LAIAKTKVEQSRIPADQNSEEPTTAVTEKNPVAQPVVLASSEEMRRIRKHAQKIASVDGPVLIAGESGTGKSLIAEFIHHKSPRRGEPVVRWGAGSFDEGTIAATLFGHTAQAFTSARQAVPGLLQSVDKGTLILDDVDALSASAQKMLLSVLDSGIIYRLGAPRSGIRTDVRIIATTNKNLDRLVENGHFRDDLLNRLRRWRLNIPPLRDRPDDVRVLATLFLRRFQNTLNEVNREKRFSSDALSLLAALPWRANCRELQEAVENAALFGLPVAHENGRLDVLDLRGVAKVLFDPHHSPVGGLYVIPETMRTEERIHRIWSLTGGNVSLTSRILGCSRNTIYGLIRSRQWLLS